MQENKRRTKLRSTLKWIGWVLLIQFVLINVCAAFYAYKFTHFYQSSSAAFPQSSNNFFAKTWRLFTGPHYYRLPVRNTPEIPYDTVDLFTKDKTKLEGWYIPVDSAKGTVVIAHALFGNKETMLSYAYEFHSMKYNVMMIDLRGHGNSGGQTTTLGNRESEDVKLAYDFVAAKGEKNIILYGFSLGAVAVIKSVYDYSIKPTHIIIDEPFASLEDHLRGRARALGFPEEPFAFFVTLWTGIERGFNGLAQRSTKYAKKIDCPVLLEYGGRDKLVLNKETESIYEHLASTHKKKVEYENAVHEFLLNSDPTKWEKEIQNFLSDQ